MLPLEDKNIYIFKNFIKLGKSEICIKLNLQLKFKSKNLFSEIIFVDYFQIIQFEFSL